MIMARAKAKVRKKNTLKTSVLLGFSTILFILCFALIGCTGQGNILNISPNPNNNNTNENLPRVVATTGVLCDLTKLVAEKTINLSCLVSPETSPQLYQPQQSDSQAIQQADLIFYNGYKFEPNLQSIINQTKNKTRKVAVAQAAVSKPLNYRQGDKIVPDPHVWHNVKNAIKMVDVINTNLKRIAPANADIYNSNKQAIKSEFSQLDTWVKQRISSIPKKGRILITTHDAMGYYTKAYGLSIPAALQGIGSNEKNLDARVKQLVDTINKNFAPTIFADTTISIDLIENVAQQARINISKNSLFADDLGASGTEGDSYENMMIANTRTIVEGLGGTYLIFQPQ